MAGTKYKDGTKMDWGCSSWHNDACDSIDCGGMQIYLPNATSENLDEEEFDTFSINNEDGNLLLTKDIEEVISFLNKY